MDTTIFKHTDCDGDGIVVESDQWLPEGQAALIRARSGSEYASIYLTPHAVRKLRKALKPLQAPKGS